MKIIFHSKYRYNVPLNNYFPSPSKNNIPNWFKKADLYKDFEEEKHKTFKSCPAILDAFISGYYLYTPCDLIISKTNSKEIEINSLSEEHAKFFNKRGKENFFPTPSGYEDIHFVWTPNWMPEVPEGYTTLFIHPLNRFDLPFLSISGFIDCNYGFSLAGNMPFFIKKGFEGVIPAGTPYMQIIPIKNENWEMELKNYNIEEITTRYHEEQKELFTGHLGETHYKERFWKKKKYE